MKAKPNLRGTILKQQKLTDSIPPDENNDIFSAKKSYPFTPRIQINNEGMTNKPSTIIELSKVKEENDLIKNQLITKQPQSAKKTIDIRKAIEDFNNKKYPKNYELDYIETSNNNYLPTTLWNIAKNSTLGSYLGSAGAGIGSLLPSLTLPTALGGVAIAGAAAYGGKKLYDYYQRKAKQERDTKLVNEQIEYYKQQNLLEQKNEKIDYLISLTPNELDQYTRQLSSGIIKSGQRLVSTLDLIGIISSSSNYANNDNLIEIAFAQAINDYHVSKRIRKHLDVRIMNFIKLINSKKRNIR